MSTIVPHRTKPDRAFLCAMALLCLASACQQDADSGSTPPPPAYAGNWTRPRPSLEGPDAGLGPQDSFDDLNLPSARAVPAPDDSDRARAVPHSGGATAPTSAALTAPTAPTAPTATPAAPLAAPSEPQASAPSFDLERDILLRSARNSLKLDRRVEAMDQYERILQIYPADRESLSEYAGLLLAQDRIDEARAHYLKLVQLAPGDLDARGKLATCWIVGGSYTEAAAQLEYVLRRTPKDSEIAALLARARAWARDYEGALTVYRQYLQSLDTSLESTRRLVAPVLLDMQQPLDALPLIQTLSDEFPSEVEWSLLLVRCQAQLGDAVEASRIADGLAEIEPSNFDKRLEVSDQLVTIGHLKAARTLYDQVLAIDPLNERARLGLAEIALEGYQSGPALRTLAELGKTMSDSRTYQRVLARYHGMVGEYGVASTYWEQILRRNPVDHDSRIAYAEMLRQAGELERAVAQLDRVPENAPASVRARIGLARVLQDQARFEEAVTLCQSLSGNARPEAEVLILLCRNLQKIGNSEQAERLCRSWLSGATGDQMAAIQVRIALGRALFDRDRPLEAVREFHEAMKHPSGRTPEAAYWLGRSYEMVGRAERAKVAMTAAPTRQLGDDVRAWIELGEIGLGEGDWKGASEAFQHVLRYDPDNVVAMVRLAEAQNIAQSNGERVDPRGTLTRVLAISEGNSRARLALARHFALGRDYEAARAQYKLLMAADPSSVLARREYARAMYWDHHYEEAFEAYDQVITAELGGLTPIDGIGESSTDASSNSGLDYEAALVVATNVANEKQAKELKDFRPRKAEDEYRDLIAAEPGNFEARFDLAQLFHVRGKTADAIEQYERIIQLSPLHREAPIALAGALTSRNPRLLSKLHYEDARGREGLYNMMTTDYAVRYEHPIGDADEYVGGGYGWRRLDPKEGGAPLLGNVLYMSGRKRLGDNTAIYADLQLPTWDESDRLSERLNYSVGLTHENYSGLRVGARMFDEYVADNWKTLATDLHRTGFRVELGYKASRALDYGLSAALADYSDANTRYEVNAYGSYLLSFAPRQLQLLAKADLTGFDQGNPDGPVVDINSIPHPYFAPSGYVLFSGIAEWKHWLNEDYFIGANDFWYSLGLRAAVDDQSETFQEFWLGVHYDFTRWARLEVRTQALSSSVLDTSTTTALFHLHWP
ncbi:MAG: tetratricopeptide repeat protein [Planctomycetes bacterium]|nr:tetratricopeptide repeat protein [Planctomycetota bacterium]